MPYRIQPERYVPPTSGTSAELRPEEAQFDPTGWLRRLRTDFPEWAILHDPFAPRWVAVRGRHDVLDARTAFQLADALACLQHGPARGLTGA